MRKTFFTDGRDLFDPTGKKVILRGVNKMSVWDESDPTGDTYFAEIRKTQANSVRIVWAIRKDLKPRGAQTDLDTLDALITNARKNQLIPMIELHDATGQWVRLQKLVDYWVQSKVVNLIQKHQDYLLVNIGNEVGDDAVKQSQFTTGYKNAVKRMREAGIHTPLVIDASDWGKNLDILNATADKLIRADPDKNLIFSVHLYWPISADANAAFIQSKLHAAVAHGYPLIVGEFSKYGGFAGEDEKGKPRSICGEFGEVDYQTILKVCDEEKIGWYAWEWGPGNDVDDPLCAVMDMTPDGRFDHLKSGWATEVVDNIKQASESQNYFRLEPAPELSAVQTRIETLKAVLSQQRDQKAVSEALLKTNGDWSKALASLTEKKELPTEALQKLALAHSLAAWSNDNIPVVKALADEPAVTSLRDVALRFNVKKLTALVDPKAVPANTVGATADEKKKNFAIALQNKLFTAEPTAVLHRMVRDAEVPIADTNQRTGVASFLTNQPEFNIRTTSVYTALKHPDAFKGIADEHRPSVVEHLKALQRVQAISPIPAAVPVLMEANLISAVRVAEIPESTFLSAHGQTLGEEAARQVYTSAINTHIRNEHALITMRESMRGTGLAIIDGQQSMEARMAKLQAVADQHAPQLNLESLFGSIDYCECDDCLSVYSPASYFVEILQYLRNNNLDPKNPVVISGQKGIENTPLEKLFRRRPDLGCLELTCENTFTVLPYIDLVNEVMESFVVHLKDYNTLPDPKQATLEVFNVLDETTSELLAQPQHINYEAYCILKNAVYPFTLPYHQPIDAIRILLNYFGTSRYELLDTYRTAHETCLNTTLTPAELQEIQKLHGVVQDRAFDAEFLGLTQEEYIILTKEAFWKKSYFDIIQQTTHTVQEYREKIGVKPVHGYYGYDNEAAMLNMDEDPTKGQKGLTFVKKQFLPRTGIQYTDLVELLKTRFINPNFPEGKALTILESIRFSYRFLQTLVDPDKTKPPTVRFAKLIEFLENPQTLFPDLEALLHPEADPCKKLPQHCPEIDSKDLRNWVLCYFDRIGQLIVLESGEGPQLVVGPLVFESHSIPAGPVIPIEGGIFKKDGTRVGTFRKDGTIMDDATGATIGHVTFDLKVVGVDGKPFIDKFGGEPLSTETHFPVFPATIDDKGLGVIRATVRWLPPGPETCNLDKVRLIHLDGSAVTAEEYDGIHRVIRLWRKLGWTIDETDKALTGLALKLAGNGASGTSGDTGADEACEFVDFDAFVDICTTDDDNGDGCGPDDGPTDDGGCPDPVTANYTISPAFLHQLVAVKKLLDVTGLPLIRLLAFWADISTAGEKSLYSRLFLTHNLLGIDKIFKPDAHGNYLTETAKITDHLPVLMAALRLKADDITAIMGFVPLTDALTLHNVTILYRHSLLAKILHLRIPELAEVIDLFGDPFKSAYPALDFLTLWDRMEDAGFTFRQLNYLIRDHDDPLRPLAPTQKTILQISKTLYDGLNAIDLDHQDVTAEKKDDATADLIRTKAGLLYEASVVEQIIGLLEGTTVYTTNAPVDSAIVIPEALAKKLKYSNQKDPTKPPSASIQVTGILTDAEKTQAKPLSNDPGWAKAVDRVGKQALQFFNDKLFGIFPNTADAISPLLAGDINVPPDPNNPTATDANTDPAKRFYFLQYFLPLLRKRLAHRLIVDALSAAASLTNDVTDILLSDILLVGASEQQAIDVLEQIHQKPAASGNDWKGYLIPSVDDAYTFIATSLAGEAQPPDILIDGQSIPFTVQQVDPTDVWSTDPATPVKLKSGKLYWLVVNGQPATGLQWKTTASPTAAIPASALLPDYSSSGTEEVFVKLYKAALVVNGFNMTVDEVSYWQAHGIDFAADAKTFDFNAVTLGHWRRLEAYASLRDKLPKTESSLLDLFKWAGKPDDATKLSEKIAGVTLWKKDYIQKLLAPEHFDLDHPEAFRNEINLVRLQKAVQVSDAVGTDIDRLFAWANPVSKFSVCHQIAEGIRATLRARYDQEDWEQVVKPLNDQLREDQKQALISYLLVQPVLIEWGVIDADSLFEFFLIDVQMDACMQTSRIKQAISSVQLFIQRCLLGLEAQYGVSSDVLDRDRWDWMQKYRVWEANRKVFLYPENWIKSELRDDKSPFYKELESELLQKDINKQTVEDALKSYLFKVDEVANLKVVGLFLEQDTGKDGKLVDTKLHIFGRTRNAPHLFYYRYFQISEQNWYPWERVQVDIPSFDQEDANGKIVDNGTYLIPVVWERRLLVFFPQFVQKSTPVDPPVLFWEIKMGWSERRNGKWTAKQVSGEAIYTTNKAPINVFRFVPRAYNDGDPLGVISVYRGNGDDFDGAFWFNGSQLTKGGKRGTFPSLPGGTEFHYYQPSQQFHSLQTLREDPPAFAITGPHVIDHKFADQRNVTFHDGPARHFGHPFAYQLLSHLTTGGLDGLFEFYLNGIPVDSLNTTKVDALADAFGGDAKPIVYHESKRANSLYNWEAAFHAPMLLVDRLLAAQQFDEALKMCHYVLNPYAAGTDDKRFWQFFPFKEIDATNVLEKLFLGLQPNTPDAPAGQINEWRDKPFQPHVVARSRPSAYMKWVAMKYIEILIAYGDYYFRQNTLETIPLAIQCYVLASHVYGPRGQKIPKRGKTLPQTYNALLDKWDAFGNAMVELELVFPFSNQTPLPVGGSNGVVGLANVFGFATTLYFCIPDNPQLRALRDTIDDRLFKIRHCQDIDGVFRHLPLFEPPIDPALLVQAAAQGLSLSSVLNDLNSPMPNYRFYYLLQKALELCSEVKAMGNAFLSVKEKGDAEALSQLRARHESSIHNLVMEVKKQQLDEAGKALDALQQSRKGPAYRLQHYLKLIGEDLGKVPDSNIDFGELPDQIEQPVDESGLKLIPYEKEEMDKAAEANDRQEDIGRIETLANIMHAVPNFNVPFLKPVFVLGGSNLGSATQAVARALQVVATNRSFSSTNAGRKANFLRQLQDRIQQSNVAGYEIKNIDKQMLTQKIRISIAEREITNQQKQIDNAQEVEEFLRNKYTNQELYSWMVSQITTSYHQAYNLSYDLAKRAEKVFRFERGLSTSNFIQYGYWDAAYDGLFSGERLYIGLKQLEAAHQEKRGHDYEVSKSISLRQISPLALIQLKETGTCEFALPEVLFDMDYPGHYRRRVKSVSLRIPCVLGAHTSLNCTLRLLEHKYRTDAIAKSKSDYPEQTDRTDDRFSTVINVPISSIAVSSLEDESGVFELNFHDERYLPFEGAGTISKWLLELPDKFRQFDYDTITDVVMRLRYTSVDGGDKLKAPAAGSVQDYIKSVEELSREEGLFAVFDLKNDFPNEWYSANHPPASATERVLTIDKLNEKLPIFTKGREPKNILAKDIYLFVSDSISALSIAATQGGLDMTLGPGKTVRTMKSFVISGVEAPMGDLKIKIQDTTTVIDKMWLLERYVLT